MRKIGLVIGFIGVFGIHNANAMWGDSSLTCRGAADPNNKYVDVGIIRKKLISLDNENAERGERTILDRLDRDGLDYVSERVLTMCLDDGYRTMTLENVAVRAYYILRDKVR